MWPNIINVFIQRITKCNENWEQVKIITRALLLINVIIITYYLYVGVIVGRSNRPTVT